jgi:hypothetical protein
LPSIPFLLCFPSAGQISHGACFHWYPCRQFLIRLLTLSHCKQMVRSVLLYSDLGDHGLLGALLLLLHTSYVHHLFSPAPYCFPSICHLVSSIRYLLLHPIYECILMKVVGAPTMPASKMPIVSSFHQEALAQPVVTTTVCQTMEGIQLPPSQGPS